MSLDLQKLKGHLMKYQNISWVRIGERVAWSMRMEECYSYLL